jgi:hypothetical protein
MATNQNQKVFVEEFDMILALSEEMYELAQKGDWDQITEKQNIRQSLMNSFFANPLDVEQAAKIEDGIQRLLDLDQKILSKGKEDLKNMSDGLNTLNHRKKAVNAYLSND